MKLKLSYQFLFLLGITLCVYYPTLSAPFNSLDDRALVNLLADQQGFSWARHFSPGGTHHYFRPFLTLSFEIDKYVGGLQEPFMHLINVLVHATNVILVWLFARRFGKFIGKPSEVLPMVAALLFALHPLNTESVNWIMARTDLLAGTFVFAALIFLLRFVEERRVLWGILSALSLLLGALCKETALFLVPGACFLLVCRQLSGPSSWSWRWIMPFLYGIAVSGYFLLRWGAFKVDRGLTYTGILAAQAIGDTPLVEAVSGSSPFPWLDALRVVLKSAGFYVLKLFQPLPLNFAIHRFSDLYVIPGLLLVAVVVLLARQRRPAGWLFLTSISLAISALFVVFTQVAWTPFAERYLYIPAAPFVVGVVHVAAADVERWSLQRLSVVVLVLLLGFASWTVVARNLVWQNNLSLYQDTVRKSPDFAGARQHLAAALREHGREEDALALLGQNPEEKGRFALLSLASAHRRAGDYVAARASLLKLLEDPGDLEFRVLDQLIQMTSDRARQIQDSELRRASYQEVLEWLERMSERWPNGFVFYRIGRIHLILNNRMEARLAFAEAARRLPTDSPYQAPAAKLARNLAE